MTFIGCLFIWQIFLPPPIFKISTFILTVMKKISLLTVDAAGTLLKPWPSVGAVYGFTARKRGILVEDEQLQAQFGKAFNEVQKNARKNQGEEKDFWRKVVSLTFKPFHNGEPINELFEELWDLFATGKPWIISDQAISTLETLSDRGYRLAVLSNNDSRLRSVLLDLKVDHLFEYLFISSERGFEKPQREIFQSVEKTMHVVPDEIMHVGDSKYQDYEGAKEAGWNPILFGSEQKNKDHIMVFPELLNILP